MFGDILSDKTGGLVGGVGMAANGVIKFDGNMGTKVITKALSLLINRKTE